MINIRIGYIFNDLITTCVIHRNHLMMILIDRNRQWDENKIIYILNILLLAYNQLSCWRFLSITFSFVRLCQHN
jgi:hypothetical protein